MKKKAIVFLTLIPFVIAVLAFVTTDFVIRKSEQDIQGISWDYENEVPFMLTEGKKKLNAEAVYNTKYPLSDGNVLVWSSSNNEIACIEKDKDNNYFLIPKKEGKVEISCYNEKETYKKVFTAIIVGDGGAIIVNPVLPFSQKSISGKKYIGLYDDIESYDLNKINSNLKLKIDFKGGSIDKNDVRIIKTDNIDFDLNKEIITFKEGGHAKLELINPYSESGSSSIEFELVNAINVYNFNDLMNVTNKANLNYPSVLRVNLESLDNTYNIDTNGKIGDKKHKDTELFGRIVDGKVMSFVDDVYQFKTTYNHEFLDQWNEMCANGTLGDSSPISINRMSGVHIRDDFYGNGFTINTHELVYPSDCQQIIIDGESITVPLLAAKDLYTGPLPFATLGEPYLVRTSLKPIFAILAQDNSSFYIDDNDVILEDVHFKGCDFGNNLTNLQYTGTTLDICADNIKIKNSIIENGRNVVRSYSSDNLLIENCLIRNGMEFLFRSGSNEFNKVDRNKKIKYFGKNNEEYITSNESFLKPIDFYGSKQFQKDYKADSLLTNGALYGTQGSEFFGKILADYTKEDYIRGIPSIIDSLSNTTGMYRGKDKVYKGSTILNKVFFVNSGISAISMDSLPQGSYLENNLTSIFSNLLGPYMRISPSRLSLTGYPTKLEIQGDTRFYDWKLENNLTFESLLVNDIKALIEQHGGLGSNYQIKITEDDFLPLKKILLDNNRDQIIRESKVNLPIYYQGGGTNLSDVIIDENLAKNFTSELELDPYIYSLDLTVPPTDHFNSDPVAKYGAMKTAMLRAASNVMGFNPYRIVALNNTEAKWINEYPKIEDLQIR